MFFLLGSSLNIYNCFNDAILEAGAGVGPNLQPKRTNHPSLFNHFTSLLNKYGLLDVTKKENIKVARTN